MSKDFPKIDGAIGDYMCDAVAQHNELKNRLDDLRMAMRRGEVRDIPVRCYIAKKSVRAIIQALNMVEHRATYQEDDPKSVEVHELKIKPK
jgi:hypothetical protein